LNFLKKVRWRSRTFPEKSGPKTILFTTDRRIRLAGLFKNCPAPGSNILKKAGWRYRIFAKKLISVIELFWKCSQDMAGLKNPVVISS
jgi:hypothetical protein